MYNQTWPNEKFQTQKMKVKTRVIAAKNETNPPSKNSRNTLEVLKKRKKDMFHGGNDPFPQEIICFP